MTVRFDHLSDTLRNMYYPICFQHELLRLTITSYRGKHSLSPCFFLVPLWRLSDSLFDMQSSLWLDHSLSPTTHAGESQPLVPWVGKITLIAHHQSVFPVPSFLLVKAYLPPESIKIPNLYFPTPCPLNMGMGSNLDPQELNRSMVEGFSTLTCTCTHTHTHAHTAPWCLSLYAGYGCACTWICSWTSSRNIPLQNSCYVS